MDLSELDIEESLKQGKLVFPQDWADRLRPFTEGSVTLLFIAAPLVALAKIDFGTGNEKIAAYTFCLLVSFFAIYVLFRIITQLRLTRISTKANETENKKIFEEYIKRYDYKLSHLSENCIVLADEIIESFSTRLSKRYYIFLLSGNDIFYCAVKKSFQGDSSISLVHYWLIWKDIKKLVRKRDR